MRNGSRRWRIGQFAAVVAVLLISACVSQAVMVEFMLDGKAGPGLLPGNEEPAATGGTGGMGPGGIVFDTDTNMLSIDIGWGSGNGFTDLTGDVALAHIHGVTASPPAGYSQNAGVLYTLHTLPGFDVSATDGGFVGTIEIAVTDVPDLMAGRTYINVHTSENPPGEIRGQLVPEPTALGLLAACGLALVRRRK